MPTLLEAAKMRKAELAAAEARKQVKALDVPVDYKRATIAAGTIKKAPPKNKDDTLEPETTIPGKHVPSTDALRVAVKLLTGVTIRGSGADARRAIQAWQGKIPKARKQR